MLPTIVLTCLLIVPPILAPARRVQESVELDFLQFAATELSAMQREGSAEEAGFLLDEVVDALEGASEPESLDEIPLLVSLEPHAKRLNRTDALLALRERAVRAFEALVDPKHPNLAVARGNLALTRKALGDLEGALDLEKKSLATWRELLPEDHRDVLAAMGNLAMTYAELGDLAGALPLDEEVHRIREKTLSADDPELMTAKLNLAATRKELGDLQGALELEEQVLEVRERTLPAEHPALVAVQGNLAFTLAELGQLERALRLAETAHAARTRSLPPEDYNRLTGQLNYAALLRLAGEPQAALELGREVHDTWERILPEYHPARYEAKGDLAATYQALGELSLALELAKEVVDAQGKILPPDHPQYLRSLANLASMQHSLGDREATRADTRRLLSALAARAAGLSAESPRVARAAATAELQWLEMALRWDEASRTDEGIALEADIFSALESLRAVSAGTTAASAAAARDPELQDLRNRVARARKAVHDRCLTPPRDPSQLEPWRRSIVDLADERDVLERQLRSRLSSSGVFTGVVTAADIASRLEERSAFVTYFRYRRGMTSDERGTDDPEPVDSLLALVVSPDARVSRLELGSARKVEAALLGWREGLGHPVAARGVGNVAGPAVPTEAELGAGAELKSLVLDPVLAAAPGANVLHVVVDDLLYLAPLESLPLGEGLVGESYQVRYETAGARWLGQRAPGEGPAEALLVGGIDYGGGEKGTQDDREIHAAFEPLPGMKAEIAAISQLFAARFDGDPATLSGEAATKSRFLSAAAGKRFVHVATHGWFAPVPASQIPGAATPPEGGRSESWNRLRESLRHFAPETLCGLALAGASTGPNEQGQVDGILTAEELGWVDLSSCELAVLSACETNVGVRRSGQGIQSLQSALHAAGARSALTSLWRVDDAATLRLMKLFYANLWTEGLGKADALWQAKMTLRAEGHPVGHWAGWVLTGDSE